MSKRTYCPACLVTWDGGAIIDTYKKFRDAGQEYYAGQTDEELEAMVKNFYGPPYRWGREIGIETDRYDGTSYTQCPDCKAIFDHWDNFKQVEKAV